MSTPKLSSIGLKVGNRYSSYAKQFSDLFDNDKTDEVFIYKFLKLVKKSGKVLDIGCGSGKDLRKIQERGFQTCGIDTSEKMLSIARKKSPNTKFFKMDAIYLDFPNSYFDGALSLYVLDHFPTDMFKKTIKEIYRVLKKSSPFLLIQHNGNFEGERIDLMKLVLIILNLNQNPLLKRTQLFAQL